MSKNLSGGDVLHQARETLRQLDPAKHNSIHTVISALIHLVESQARLADDLVLLHRKLQPILKHLEEENGDWRLRYPKYDE